jgi:hypothetical protein
MPLVAKGLGRRARNVFAAIRNERATTNLFLVDKSDCRIPAIEPSGELFAGSVFDYERLIGCGRLVVVYGDSTFDRHVRVRLIVLEQVQLVLLLLSVCDLALDLIVVVLADGVSCQERD